MSTASQDQAAAACVLVHILVREPDASPMHSMIDLSIFLTHVVFE